jgi:hypothetical protein
MMNDTRSGLIGRVYEFMNTKEPESLDDHALRGVVNEQRTHRTEEL